MPGPDFVRVQYKNVNRQELVFTDGRFVKYEQLPLDHMKLFSKDLSLTADGLYYKSFLLGGIKDNLITWVNNKIFDFPVE